MAFPDFGIGFLQRLLGRDFSGELRILAPDLTEKRGDRVLHIWRELAHWAVLDAEAAEFFARLQKTPNLEAVFSQNSQWKSAKSEILPILKALAEPGVVSTIANPFRERPVYDGKPPLIENIAINLTRRCNLRCRFCSQLDTLEPAGQAGSDLPSEVSPEDIGRFLGQASALCSASPSITILGGEPLLRAEALFQILRRPEARRFRGIVSTNGLLVTPDFARSARDLNLEVQVSLDGPTEGFHDPGRGSGTFSRTREAVRILVEAGARTLISMVCHSGNLSGLTAYYQLAQTLGVGEARFIPLKLTGGANHSGVSPVPLPKLLQTAVQLFSQHPEFIPLAGRDALSIFGNMARFSLKRQSCGSAIQTVLIDADGGLLPCMSCMSPSLRFGTISDPNLDFPRIWQTSEPIAEFRRETNVTRPENPCFPCPVKYWCLGGCRGETFAVKGKLNAQSPFCGDLRRALLDSFWFLTDHPALLPGA
jgi:radical SAM protein with 4Fe4S-binding SPASM domain